MKQRYEKIVLQLEPSIVEDALMRKGVNGLLVAPQAFVSELRKRCHVC